MKWKNYNHENSLYFVTTTIRDFVPLFEDENIVSIILDSWMFLRLNKGLDLYAYVIMPEHVHFIAKSEQVKINTLVGDFKRFTSRQIAKYLEEDKADLFEKFKKAAYKGQNYAIWQETFRSEVVTGRKFLEQKINYIHNNPVKRGLVSCPGDWKLSSFRQLVDLQSDESVFKVDMLVSV